MSFPSIGTKALYRNNIENVAKFFEEKYSDPEHIDYMIYNLCSEMEYDHRKFHGNVKRFRIDDHNVPTLEMMFELTDSVREWLGGDRERERVVSLHCKGGKGRTGTMICAILIDMGLFKVSGSNPSTSTSAINLSDCCSGRSGLTSVFRPEKNRSERVQAVSGS